MSEEKSRPSWHTGFFLVMGLTVGLGVFLALSAGRRAESDGWGYPGAPDLGGRIPSGFVVVDMSGAFVAMKESSGAPGSGGIGPLPSGSDCEEEYVILDELTLGDSKSLSLIHEMDQGGDENAVTLKELSDVDGEPVLFRKEDSPGKVDIMEGITLDEVSAVWEEHTVSSGENLCTLARGTKVTQDDIVRANALANPDSLYLGQILLIPLTPGDVPATLKEVQRRRKEQLEKENRIVPLEIKEYLVKDGDSLWTIANEFNVTVDTLFGSNPLKDPDYLKPGVKLKIPNQNGLFYTVRKGDVLGAIAKAFSVDIDKIAGVNKIKKDGPLSVGQVLFLPGASQAAQKQSGSSVSGSRRSFRWPVVGRINSPYGWRRHPLSGRRSFHSGIDIKATRHTKIKAAKAGTVVHAGWMGGYGRVVVVRHDSTYSTLYGHCERLYVKKGQKVSLGAVIASVGSSGRTTGPHLHFEVRVHNRPDNPLKYLR